MSEKRRVYGRIDLKGGDEAAVTPARPGAKTSSPSLGLSSGPRARVVVNNTQAQSRVGVESPLSRQDAATGSGVSSSSTAPQSAYGGRVAAGAAGTGARSSPTVGDPPARTTSTAAGIVAAAGGRARVLGYSSSPSSASPAGPSSTPMASSVAASSPFATPGATSSPLAHPLPASVSTRAFDRRVRAASTEPHDSPTASLARNHQSIPPGSAHAPARPGSPRRPFPTSRATTIPSSGTRINTDVLGDGNSAPADQNGSMMPPPVRPRVTSRVTVADPTNSYSLSSRPAAANGLLPPASIASSSSSTSLGLGSSAGPGRLKTSSSAVFARSTTSSPGAGPAGSSASASSLARPVSPVRQRPGSPLRRPASPVRPAAPLTRSLAPSAIASAATPIHTAAAQRETQATSALSPASPRRPAFEPNQPPRPLPNTLLPSSPSFSKLSASHTTVHPPTSSSITNAKRPSTSSQSSSSSASYSTLSPEIFSDSAKTVRHTPKSTANGLSPIAVAASHFQRARRRSRSHSVNSSISSLSGVSGVSQGKGKAREQYAGSGEASTSMNVSASVGEGDEVLQSPLQYAARPASQGPATLAPLESPRVPTEDDLLKEKEYRDAKTKRKILDLEITNTSLLAINSSLEKAKVKQSAEIRSLRRQLRERASLAPLHSSSLPLLSPATDEYGFATSPDPDNGGEWGEEREMDWDEILRLDGQFADVVRLLEGLNRRARTALEAAPEGVEPQPGRGGKVLNAFDVEEERRRRAREERDSGVAGVTALAGDDRGAEIDGDSEGDRLDENDTTIASSSVASSVDENEAEEGGERESANVSGVGGFTLDSPELSLGVD